MPLAFKFKLVLLAAAGFAAPIAASLWHPIGSRESTQGDRPALVELRPGSALYRAAGDFTRAGKPAEAPLTTVRIAHPLAIMKHQVSGADYQRCVADRACRGRPLDVAIAIDRPAVQVSWRDADAYAAWLSRKTGDSYRLPTDEEWAYAAGSRYQDDGLAVDDSDPARRWLARYEQESNRKEAGSDGALRPLGGFGANENGLFDVAGNVWEWTNTCFLRTAIGAAGEASVTMNCGVRVVEGRHRSYVTDFIRDARAGGCAAGVPPSNLGFRLVREQASWMRRIVTWAGLTGRV